MDKLAAWCLPFVRKGGRFIAMKGPNFGDELEDARKVIKRFGGGAPEVVPLTLPRTDIARNLIIIKK
jgi:16S rRNA (guanine527-N7)-methyltransferase